MVFAALLSHRADPNIAFPSTAGAYPDGLRALARYAGLEVIEASTQWEDLPQYDNESNKWHDSVLIARKLLGAATAGR